MATIETSPAAGTDGVNGTGTGITGSSSDDNMRRELQDLQLRANETTDEVNLLEQPIIFICSIFFIHYNTQTRQLQGLTLLIQRYISI